MKNLKSLRFAIVIATAITFLGSGCSKDRSTLVNSTAKPTTQVKDIQPDDQKFGAVKGFVLPADAKAIVSLTNSSDASYYSTSADNTGFFDLEKIPAGLYTIDVLPSDPAYGGIQFDVIVNSGLTTILNITLTKK